VVDQLAEGRVIPFLGAGVNLYGRPKKDPWRPGQDLPSGVELAAYLATKYGYPKREARDLVRVSQFVEVMGGLDMLYSALRPLFASDYRPNELHRLLADLPRLLREKGSRSPFQLIITTNYDDALERAFMEKDPPEPFDLVSYIARGERLGKFLHRGAEGDTRPIERPNEYTDVSTEDRTVILKLHGAVDRADPEGDSYVITEDNYIDYLTRTDLSLLIPVSLREQMSFSHFLFLGYSLRDWNLRVILNRIWAEHTLKSWAINSNPGELEKKFWAARGGIVDVLEVRLEKYVTALAAELAPVATAP
jgi:hypothetical protein